MQKSPAWGQQGQTTETFIQNNSNRPRELRKHPAKTLHFNSLRQEADQPKLITQGAAGLIVPRQLFANFSSIGHNKSSHLVLWACAALTRSGCSATAPATAAAQPELQIIGIGRAALRTLILDNDFYLLVFSFVVDRMTRQTRPLSFSQAVDASPSLARLVEMVRDSTDMLKSVQRLLPTALRTHVKAGPIDGEIWCLLVSSNAAAAKVRQLIPSLQAELKSSGWKVYTIRIKVLIESALQR